MIIQISQYLSKIYFQKKNIYVKLNLTHTFPLLSYKFQTLIASFNPPPPVETRRKSTDVGHSGCRGQERVAGTK